MYVYIYVCIYVYVYIYIYIYVFLKERLRAGLRAEKERRDGITQRTRYRVYIDI